MALRQNKIFLLGLALFTLGLAAFAHFFTQYGKRVVRPELYHGKGKTEGFFEGYFYKLITPSGERLAIVPGIYLPPKDAPPAPKDAKGYTYAHAFIFVHNGKEQHYYTFPPWEVKGSEMTKRKGEFSFSVGHNVFTHDSLTLDLDVNDGDHAESAIQASLNFTNRVTWPVSFTSPGAMGYYGWLPFLECYHGVLALDFEVSGSLNIDGRSIDLTGSRGYLEKDWGSNFPSSWVWLQANTFDEVSHEGAVSFTFALAQVPLHSYLMPVSAPCLCSMRICLTICPLTVALPAL